MKRFSAFLSEEITSNEIRRLREEGYMWTKNVSRIQNGRDLADVYAAYRVWRKYCEEFIYNRVLGMKGGQLPENEPWESKNLREKAWSIVVSIEDEFAGGDYNRARYGSGELSKSYSGSPDMWDYIYTSFDKDRKNIYTRIWRKIKDAFDALDEYVRVHAKDGVLPDRAKPTIYNIDGIQVTVTINDLEKKEIDRYVRDGLEAIRTAMRAIRTKRLNALSGIEITLRPGDVNWDTAGTYGGNHINLYAFGLNAHTVAHEIGHHYYNRLSYERQRAWDAFIVRNRIVFTEEELAHIKRAFFDTVADRRNHPSTVYTINDFWTHCTRRITDPGVIAKWPHFANTLFGRNDRQRFLTGVMVKSNTGEDHTMDAWLEFEAEAKKAFLVGGPTAYANKNAGEAFAEVFAFYVLDKPLTELMRVMFADTTGLQ